MAISVIQTATGTGNPPCTFGSSITLGNTVILIAPCYDTSGTNNTISAVKIGTNTIAGTFACFNNGTTGTVNSGSSGGNVASLAVWVIPNIQVSGQTTVDYTPSGSQVGQVAYEVAGLGTSPTLDQSASGSGITTGSVTTGATGAITGSPELIVGGSMIFAGATGAPSGFTTANPTGDCWAGYQIATSSGGTYTWTQTGNGNPWAAALATILGTPAAPPPFRLMVSAPWRPAPPPRLLAAQVITAPLPAPPLLLAGTVQAEGVPYRAPWQVPPRVLASATAPQAVTATAGVAAISVVAPGATVAEGVTAGVSTVLVAATQETAAVVAFAGVAAVAVSAPAASVAEGVTASVSTVLAVAPATLAAETVTAGVGIINAADPGATVNTSGNTNAVAGPAAVAALAMGPSPALVVTAGVAAVAAMSTAATVSSGNVAFAGVAAVAASVASAVTVHTAIATAAAVAIQVPQVRAGSLPPIQGGEGGRVTYPQPGGSVTAANPGGKVS